MMFVGVGDERVTGIIHTLALASSSHGSVELCNPNIGPPSPLISASLKKATIIRKQQVIILDHARVLAKGKEGETCS